MARSITGRAGPATATFIYDGDCGFCTRSARWLGTRWVPGRAESVPWQHLGEGGLRAMGLDLGDVQHAAWWVGPDGRLFRGHRAIGRSLTSARPPWPIVGWLLLTPPLSWLAAAVYWAVARWRYRLPGGTAACRLDR